MTKVKWVLGISIFLYLFSVGAGIGQILANGQKTYKILQSLPPLPSIETTSVERSSKQNSILLVLVEDLISQQSRLEGVWLIIWTSDAPKITLMSLYPVTAAPQLSNYSSPHKAINISPLDFAGIENLEVINKQKAKWDNIILVDDVGFESIIQMNTDQFSKIDDPNQHKQILKDYPRVWDNPSEALAFQEGLLQFLCMHSDSLNQYSDFQSVIKLLGNHFYTTLDNSDLQNIWNDLNTKDFIIDCKFPYQ